MDKELGVNASACKYEEFVWHEHSYYCCGFGGKRISSINIA